MLKLIAALVLIFGCSTQALAGASVYCKMVKGQNFKVYNARSADGRFVCADHLREGAACFTGARKEVIDLINTDAFNWDEEWLESAHFKGTSSVAYDVVDGSNDMRFSASISRCAKGYFTRPEVGPFLIGR